VELPASWRLRQDTVSIIGPALYPTLPFVSAAVEAERKLTFGVAGSGDGTDRALDLLTGGATMVGLLLPASDGPVDNVDEDVSRLTADVVERLLKRGALLGAGRPLLQENIGCIDPHVASGARTRAALRGHGLSTDAVMVETPEIWQGLQLPLLLVKHPLSGKRRLDGFVLEPGRLGVALSRHLVACIIVGRDGVREALDSHDHDCSERPMSAEDSEWAGWRAHWSLWDRLEQLGRLVRV
jgi:hypothetical protein